MVRYITVLYKTVRDITVRYITVRYKTVRYKKRMLFETVRVTKRYVTVRQGYKTVTVTKRYVLQNGNCYYGLGGRLLYPNLTLDMVRQTQQNSTNLWISRTFALT